MSDFVHLHLHTEYSLLDGAAKISEIADKAISDGQRAVAITDHGVMYGVVEFYNALKEKGIKPIIGCEVYVARGSRKSRDGKGDMSGNHLVLLCKNDVGYKNLCYMVSMSFIDGFYSKPRIDMELIREHHEGLIALSGCIAGKIPALIISGNMEEAEGCALEFRSIFGDDFYLEIQNHGLEEERKVAHGINLISKKTGIPMVATNDVHYINKNDSELQATLMCIQTNNVITDGKPFGFETDEFYFKTADEMEKLFRDFDGAVENTLKIAEKCYFDFEFDKLHLPDFKPEGGLTHKEKLAKDTYAGFDARLADGRFDIPNHKNEEYTERIAYELSVIDKMGFNAYFLIVADFVAYAKRSGIPVGPGRGSGAGSLVAFCMGITDVDPIAFGLLFERFLNSERVSMPDFDIDFCYNRRDEVIDYVKSKYGDDKVAQIVTFGTLAARAAVRDVGRALGIPYGKVDTVAKLIPREMNITIDSALNSKELKELYMKDESVRRLIDMSHAVEGMPRHASTHAAGVVITERPTFEYVPLSYSGTGIVTQFDMNTDAKLGLVKFDFLGLRYLTVIDDAEKAVKEINGAFDIQKIPLDDYETFRLLRDGRTDGVFQLESAGMKQVLSKLKPSNLEDVIACIALYRPGPMESIDDFIAVKNGKKEIEYKTYELREILDVTYGCIVYQEQVMQICRKLAGYSYAHADIVRRAMSKKKTDAMIAERESFILGCKQNNISEQIAESVFEDMVGFAKYAFNKSHATAYGILSYRTAYLKAHYPAQYFSALLTSVLDSSAKVKEYIADAYKHGIKVLPPDVNSSREYFSANGDSIRFGLLAIKNVGRQFADALIKERLKKPFLSFDDFVSRMAKFDINKRTIESMIKCGVFDSLGKTRNTLISCYEDIVEAEHSRLRNSVSGQIDLFGLSSTVGENITCIYPEKEEFSLKELLMLEKESSGMYFSGHMADNYSLHIDALKPDKISEIINDFDENSIADDHRYKDKTNVTVAGIISEKRIKVTQKGDTMAYLKLDDRSGEIDILVFARQYSRFSEEIFEENAVKITGTLSQEETEAPRIVLTDISPLIANADFDKKNADRNDCRTVSEQNRATKYDQNAELLNDERIFIKVSTLADIRLDLIRTLASLYKGDTKVVIFDESTKKYSVMSNITVMPSKKVMDELRDIFSPQNVILK